MKICMISTYPPTKCGIAEYTSELCKILAQRQIDINVLTYKTPNSTEKNEVNPNLKIYRKLSRNINGWKLWSEIKKIAPDIIHIQVATLLHNPLLYTVAYFAKRTPIVATVHDATHTPFRLGLLPYTLFLRILYKHSIKIFALSNFVKEILINTYSVDASKIVLIPHGVDIKKYNPYLPASDFKIKHDLDGSFVILFFGFLRPNKGIEYLLDAFKIVSTEIKNAKLVIAGDIPENKKRYFLGLKSEVNYKNQLIKIVNKLEIEKSVIFTGYIPEEEIPSCFASADVVVFPYLGASQSGSLHKALASGSTIIATAVGGFPKLVENNKTGLLVPPKDSDAIAEQILRLYGNKSLHEALKRNARKRAEDKLSWEKVSNKTVEVYSSIIK